jgi:hypothetical protein
MLMPVTWICSAMEAFYTANIASNKEKTKYKCTVCSKVTTCLLFVLAALARSVPSVVVWLWCGAGFQRPFVREEASAE